jgi:alkanesulfonate monooxygenase SsuD/methylene tetrahydromethanopterin reductase-like flavin-dependent oxidoreductase (luciferase family)
LLLDIFAELQRVAPWSRAYERELIHDTVAQAQLCDELGYDCWWCVEHHGAVPFSMSSTPELFNLLLAQATKRMRIGHAGVLAPFGINHPLRVAERAAFLDIISEGRLEFGLARSSNNEWDNFDVPGEISRQQAAELFRMLPEMWSDGPFSWNTDLLHVPEIDVVPKPVQEPHPPFWLTGTSPDAFKMAGSLGVGGIATTLFWPVETIAALNTIYRQAISECDQPAGAFLNNQFGCFTFVHCAATREDAIRAGAAEAAMWYVAQAPVLFAPKKPGTDRFVLRGPFMEAIRAPQVARNVSWRHAEGAVVDPVDPDDPVPVIRLLNRAHLGWELDPEEVYETLEPIDSVIIGDPDTCLAKMKKFAEAGVDRLLCLQQFGGLAQEDIMSSIELVGKELLPALAG